MTETTAIVSLAEMKEHLGITINVDDTLIPRLLETARRHMEKWCGPLDDFEEGVPDDLKGALKLLAGHLYENREASYIGQGTVTEVPFGFHDLIGPYRQWEF